MFDTIVPKCFEGKVSQQAVNFSDDARSELDFIKECLQMCWEGAVTVFVQFMSQQDSGK